MKILFKEIFFLKNGSRLLSVDYLRDKRFSARPVLDAFNMEDLQYFDEATGEISPSNYRLYHAEWGCEATVDEVKSISDLAHKFHGHFFEDTIIEYVGKKFFIWNMESECYVIFGEKRTLDLITDAAYGPEAARKSIDDTGDEKEKAFLLSFYKSYSIP